VADHDPSPPSTAAPSKAALSEARPSQGDGQGGQAPVIEVKDLVVRYDQQVVLNGVSMTVNPGEVMVILGGSGSGKSTLLKCLLGVTRPVSGTVKVLGVDMTQADERTRETLYRRLGMVYQSGALFGSMTVGDNIRLPLREHTRLDDRIIDISMRMKLGLVHLSGFEDRLPSQLSGGQAKRAAFARAIALDPELLFCDEPSAGLDPRIGRGLDLLIRNLNKAFRMAIVVVTHEMESVKVIADRITMLAPMAGGARVAFCGTYDEMLAHTNPVVREFVERAPLQEPRTEAGEILRQLVGEE
jgi:phospholipid/cholesterol/gamma-HCH transport system ATP-binding protein